MIISCIDRCGRSHMTYWKGVVLGDEDQDGKRRILLPYGSHSSLPLILKVPCFLTIFFSPVFTYCYFCLFPKCDASHLVLLQCISPWPFLKLTGWFPFFILVWFLISVVSTIIEQPVSHHLAPTPAPNGKKKTNKTKQSNNNNKIYPHFKMFVSHLISLQLGTWALSIFPPESPQIRKRSTDACVFFLRWKTCILVLKHLPF